MLKALVLVATLSGCSVTLQARPKQAASALAGDCSTTHAWWVTDAALATVAAVGGGAVYVATSDTENSDLGTAAAGAAVIASVVYLASAHNGYKWRGECAAGTSSVATTASR